jgi:hypothetical protein
MIDRRIAAILALSALACGEPGDDDDAAGKADDPEAVAGCLAALDGAMAARRPIGYRYVLDRSAGGARTTTTLLGDGKSIEQVTPYAEEGAAIEIAYVGGLGELAGVEPVQLGLRTGLAAEQRVAMVTERFNDRAFSHATLAAPAAGEGEVELWFQRAVDGSIHVDRAGKSDRIALRHAVAATACFGGDVDGPSLDGAAARGGALAVAYDPRRLLAMMGDDGVRPTRWTIDLIATVRGDDGHTIEERRTRLARAGGAGEVPEVVNALIPVDVPSYAGRLDLAFEAVTGDGERIAGPDRWVDDDGGDGYAIALD